MLDDQTFLVKKNFVEKFLSQKDSGSKIVFCLEKLDRVNPRGGYMTPPPENSWVQILLGHC